MNNIITRTVWGTLFIVIIISSFLVGKYATAYVLGFFMCIGVYEFYRFFKPSKVITPLTFVGTIGAALIYVSLILMQLGVISFPLIWILIPVLFLPFLNILLSKKENPLLDLTVTFFPWLYVMFPFYLMFSIYNIEVSTESQWTYILGLFILVWTNDTFAYLSGRSFGKHKLFERISPKKTWEGTIGGLLFTLLASWIYAYFVDGSILFWIIAGLIISPASVIGDLIESKFKRIVKVKDSGTILPGHGGILDRFDAVIYAAPFFYLLLSLF